MKKYSNKYEKMANAPVKSLIASLAVPTIITMLVSAVYNMADSYFVGRIDTASVASIGIVFSIMTLLQAIGFLFGHGSGIMISSMLGEKNKEAAQKYANTALFISFTLGIVLAIIGSFMSQSIAKLLGATQGTLIPASQYLKYILIGAPFILTSFVLNNQLRYQGSAVYSMTGIMSGSILNIILDPIFIFKLDMGVKGAAIATVISQFIGFIILIGGTYKNDNIRINFKYITFNKIIISNIFKNGLPSLARQGIMTVGNICLNFASGQYGDAAVAGMSVFNRVMFIGMAVVIGIGQGFQPVCAFNFSAKDYKRVYEGYKFTILLSTIFITCFAIISFIFAFQIISLFRDDEEVIAFGALALRADCIVMPLTGYYMSTNMLIQSIRMPKKATVLAIARQGLFYIPLILILPLLFDKYGLAYTQAVCDFLSFILSLLIATPVIKQLKNNKKLHE